MFILGFIFGFLSALGVVLLEIFLEIKHYPNITKLINKKVEEKLDKKVKILYPTSELKEKQDALLEKNARKGKDTPLEELGL